MRVGDPLLKPDRRYAGNCYVASAPFITNQAGQLRWRTGACLQPGKGPDEIGLTGLLEVGRLGPGVASRSRSVLGSGTGHERCKGECHYGTRTDLRDLLHLFPLPLVTVDRLPWAAMGMFRLKMSGSVHMGAVAMRWSGCSGGMAARGCAGYGRAAVAAAAVAVVAAVAVAAVRAMAAVAVALSAAAPVRHRTHQQTPAPRREGRHFLSSSRRTLRCHGRRGW